MKSRCNHSKMKPGTLPARQGIVISCCSPLSMLPPARVEKELERGIKKSRSVSTGRNKLSNVGLCSAMTLLSVTIVEQ